MIDRRSLISAAILGLLCAPVAGEAKESAKVFYIGILYPDRGVDSLLVVFRQELHRRGYVEDRNVVFDYRMPALRDDPLHELAGELVRLKVDVIVALGTPSALAARAATRTTPVVFFVAARALP